MPSAARIRGITWAMDGSALIIGQHDWTSDIVLMDGTGRVGSSLY